MPIRCHRLRTAHAVSLALMVPLLAGLAAAPAQAQIRWRLTELRTGGSLSFATGINARGDVVGMDLATLASNGWEGPLGGWLVTAGQATALPLVPSSAGLAFVAGLNDEGQIVGQAVTDTPSRLLRWTTQDPPYTTATGLALPSTDFYAGGITRAGVVIGHDGAGNPLLWNQGIVTPLARPVLSSGPIQPTGMNSQGYVVGSSFAGTPFLWRPHSPSGMSEADPPGLGSSFASAAPRLASTMLPLVGITDWLNATVATDATGPVLAFDLGDRNNDLGRGWLRPQVDALPGGAVLSFANAVNDLGQIAGMSSNGRAAVATPYGTLTWQRGSSSLFSDPRNWSGMSDPSLDTGPRFFAPSRLLSVVLATPDMTPANSTAVMDADAEVKFLQIGGSFNPLGGNRFGTLTMRPGLSLTSQSDVLVHELGTLDVTNGFIQVGAGGGALRVAGVARLNGLTLAGGPLVVTSTAYTEGKVFASGTVTAPSVTLGLHTQLIATNLTLYGDVQVNGASFRAQGATHLYGYLRGQGQLVVDSDGPLILERPFGVGDSFDVRVHARSGLQALDRIENDRSFTIEERGWVSAKAFVQHAGSLVVDGELSTPNGRVSLVGGVLSGNGRINGDLFVGGGRDVARFNPGHSPGSFTIDGDFQLLPGGELELEVAKAADGTLAFDHVAARHISLDGTVRLKLAPDLAGATFQQLQLLGCGGGCDFGSGFKYVLDGSGASVTWTAQGLSLGIAAVPEPASRLLWPLGLLAIAALRRLEEVA